MIIIYDYCPEQHFHRKLIKRNKEWVWEYTPCKIYHGKTMGETISHQVRTYIKKIGNG